MATCLLRYPLIRLFNDDPEVLRIGSEVALMTCAFYALFSCTEVFSASMRGVPVLFVEDLTTAEAADADYYRGFSALLVKAIPGFGAMSAAERRELDVRLLGGLFYGELVAAESGHDLQEMVTVKREYTGVEGSSMYLREGEQLFLRWSPEKSVAIKKSAAAQ